MIYQRLSVIDNKDVILMTLEMGHTFACKVVSINYSRQVTWIF